MLPTSGRPPAGEFNVGVRVCVRAQRHGGCPFRGEMAATHCARCDGWPITIHLRPALSVSRISEDRCEIDNTVTGSRPFSAPL